LKTRVADATTDGWWDGKPFDGILLDAPCSGTGTIRRHPDIKVLKQEATLENLFQLQLALLTNLWRMLSPGGTLVFSTCSILSDENDQVIQAFLSQNNNASVQIPDLPEGKACHHGRQILPTENGSDGFYYSLLYKSKAHKN
jgi:16S rRNA (cytosine967-C5)-methyltransferase